MNSLQTTKKSFTSQFKNLEQAMEVAKIVSTSNFVPTSMKGKEGDVLVAFMHGMEVGLKPMQALQGIAVINGRPCIWGKSLLALVKAHPEFESIEEWSEGETAFCKIKRKGQPEVVRTFSQEDAKIAGLASKQGPWRQYPGRMRQHRARGFAIADSFPDAMCGLELVEEARDYQVMENKSHEEVQANEVILREKDIDTWVDQEIDSSEKIDRINDLLEERDVEIPAFFQWHNDMGAESLETMSTELMEKAIRMLEKKPMKSEDVVDDFINEMDDFDPEIIKNKEESE